MAQQILIVYEGMLDAASCYDKKAAELRDLCKQIQARNNQLVSSEWNADTAVRFQERFNEDHAAAIEKVALALDDIAGFIRKYVAHKQEDDSAQAGMI